MKIGFTGTREGLTNPQKRTLASLLSYYASENAERFVHGACVGADGQACKIAKSHAYTTVARPSNIPNMQTAEVSDINLHPRSPLERNRDIVLNSDMLIACPREDKEVMRSGTWATIRFAVRKAKKHTVVILPNGHCKDGKDLV
jgi:hypothetical protein